MSSSYIPRSSPRSSRLHLLHHHHLHIGRASRLRSSSVKKLSEPLQRAVADCLSPSSSSFPASLSSSAASPAFVTTKASRTLREGSPTVRQLRITDSPFSLRDIEEDDNRYVDMKVEEFIEKFYKELKK